jgi:hypothetical protein
MSVLVALNFEQTLDLVKAYVNANNLSGNHVKEIFNIIYSVCAPGRQYQPHQVLYDRIVVEETLAKIRLE